ncbi:hypothetical protein QBB34_21285 [Streptomyces stelliscabiei]|uniref:hypothetical protein n=1 Tax=Streptomyces stelliscabiei TaxID=146820 RepID=UPI002FF05A02
MDSTQSATQKPQASNAMLVTSTGLGAGNIGFIAGIFGSAVGDQGLYAATATGFGAAVVAFALGMSIVSFVRKGAAA